MTLKFTKQHNAFYKLTGLILSLFSLLSLVSCTVIEPPARAYPPARQPTPAKPAYIPQPMTKPVVKPKAKPKLSVVKTPADEPEQGKNPYDDVPQRTSSAGSRNSSKGGVQGEPKDNSSSNVPTSSAVKSLITQAKVEMAVKRNAAAINKLERALRIEPRNPAIWHQLAKANYNEGKDATAISMAKKSNIYTAADSPLEKLNWQLIKSASKRSGNIRSLKEAIRYDQTHP